MPTILGDGFLQSVYGIDIRALEFERCKGRERQCLVERDGLLFPIFIKGAHACADTAQRVEDLAHFGHIGAPLVDVYLALRLFDETRHLRLECIGNIPIRDPRLGAQDLPLGLVDHLFDLCTQAVDLIDGFAHRFYDFGNELFGLSRRFRNSEKILVAAGPSSKGPNQYQSDSWL